VRQVHYYHRNGERLLLHDHFQVRDHLACPYSSKLPLGSTLGREVGEGSPSRNDWADNNGSKQCPCLVFVSPTSDFLVALQAVRSPDAGRPLPVEIDEVGMVVVPRARTCDRCGCR
jgi:hypothetical protein